MDLHYPFIVSHLQLRSGNDTPPTMNEVSSVLERVVSAPSSLTEADQRLVMQIYDVSVSHVDKQLGELVEQLQSEGIWDNTVVLVCVDHGEELFEHGRYGHSAAEADNPFPDELIHIPLILKLPYSQSAGIRVDEMVCQLDIPATLCALAGAEKPPSWLGRSLLTLLRAQSTRPCGEVLTQEGYRHAYIAAYRTSGWKLIVNALDGAKRLYKLSPTADESTNVATEYHDVVTRLYEEVRRHFSTHSNAYSAKRIANVEIDEEMKEQLRGLGYLE